MLKYPEHYMKNKQLYEINDKSRKQKQFIKKLIKNRHNRNWKENELKMHFINFVNFRNFVNFVNLEKFHNFNEFRKFHKCYKC